MALDSQQPGLYKEYPKQRHITALFSKGKASGSGPSPRHGHYQLLGREDSNLPPALRTWKPLTVAGYLRLLFHDLATIKLILHLWMISHLRYFKLHPHLLLCLPLIHGSVCLTNASTIAASLIPLELSTPRCSYKYFAYAPVSPQRTCCILVLSLVLNWSE